MVRFVAPFDRDLGASAWVGAINEWPFFTGAAYTDRLASLTAPVVVINTNAFHWKEVVDHPRHLRAAQAYGVAGATRHELYRLAFDALFGEPRGHAVEELRRALDVGGKGAATATGGAGGGRARVGVGAAAATRTERSRPASLAGRQQARSNAPAGRVAGLLAIPPPTLPLVGVQLRTGGVGEAWEETAFHRHPLTSVTCFAREAAALCR